MSQITKIEIADGNYYGAYQPLIWTVVTADTSLTFTIDFLGQTISKRVLSRNGSCILSLASILDKIKTNNYNFRPFSVYGLGAFEDLDISHTASEGSDNITVKIGNSLTSVSNALLSKDFLTPQQNLYNSDEFEVGVFFAGEITLRYTTDQGIIEQTVGVENDISFQSFRDISFTLGEGATKVNGKGIGVDDTTEIIGFAVGDLDTATFYGTSLSVSINAEGNILTFSGAGVLTSIQLASGERISFAGLTDDFLIAMSDENNQYFVSNPADLTSVSDSSLFVEQRNGCTKFDNGVILTYSEAKEIQL